MVTPQAKRRGLQSPGTKSAAKGKRRRLTASPSTEVAEA